MTSSYSSSLKIVEVFERDEIHRKLSRKSGVTEPGFQLWQRQLMYGAEGCCWGFFGFGGFVLFGWVFFVVWVVFVF